MIYYVLRKGKKMNNKEILADNLKRLMYKKGVTPVVVCNELGFKVNTYSNWIHAKIYPRIDKIEKLADYFGVSKSELIEEYHAENPEYIKGKTEAFQKVAEVVNNKHISIFSLRKRIIEVINDNI